MKTPKNPITVNYKKIRMLLKEGNIREAEELLNWGIAYLANATFRGIQTIDKVDVDLWKDRYWFEIENHGLLDDGGIVYDDETLEEEHDGYETW
jgi:hydrogenase maturation factor